MTSAFELDYNNSQSLQPRSMLAIRSLQDAAVKLADLKNSPRSLSTKTLVSLLICQAQRNKRLVMAPVRIHLRVGTALDGSNLKLRLGATNS